MTELDVPTGIQRCDKCIKDHKKCTREISGCQRCQKFGFKCSYLRLTKKKASFKGNQIFLDSTQVINLDLKIKHISGKDKNRCNIIKYGIYNFPNVSSINIDIKILLKSLQLRSPYNTLISVQGGSVFDDQKEFNVGYNILSHLRLAIDLGKESHKVSILSVSTFEDFSNGYKDLKEKAFDAYFKYYNSISPLFLKSKFKSKKRGDILMAAIYVSGLELLPKCPRSQKLTNYYLVKITNYLKTLNFYPNLETLQIMILINSGLKHIRSLANHINVLFEVICHFTQQLGLQYNPPGRWSKIELLERKLCLSSIFYLAVCRIIIHNSPSPFPSYMYDEELNLVDLSLNITNLSSDIKPMFVGEANFYLAFNLFYFHEQKKYYEENFEQCSNFVKLNIIQTRKCIKRIYDKYLYTKYRNILDNNDEININSIRSRYYTHVLLLSRYTLLKAQSSKDLPLYPDRIKSCKNSLKFAAKQVIQHVNDTPAYERIYLHYGIAYFSLMFLFLYLDQNDPEVKEIINLGVNLIQDKDKTPVSSYSVPPLIDHLQILNQIRNTT